MRKQGGHYEIFSVTPSGLWLPLFKQNNANVKEGGAILTQLLAGRVKYKLGAVYFEFANVASPGDPVSVPDVEDTEGRDYFDNLGVDRDYLRVQITTAPTIRARDGDESLFDEELGNDIEYYCISEGEAGINGLPFGYGSNSVVYGMALVATPEWSDRTKDLIFARGYYNTSNQIAKPASNQVGVRWVQPMGP